MGVRPLGPAAASSPQPSATAKALEALVIRHLLQATVTVGRGASPAHEHMFLEVLASAIADGGGFGLAEMLDGSLCTGGARTGTPPPPAGAASAPAGLERPAAAGPAAEAPDANIGRPPSALAPAPPGSLSRGEPPAAAVPFDELLAGGGRLTSRHGLRIHPLTGQPSEHRGVDVAAREGTLVLAAADGVVRRAGEQGGYGQAVVLDHGEGWSTLYGHASELLVGPGEVVRRGQPIARVGHTGVATGPHLHFEVRAGGRSIDPMATPYLSSQRVDRNNG